MYQLVVIDALGEAIVAVALLPTDAPSVPQRMVPLHSLSGVSFGQGK